MPHSNHASSNSTGVGRVCLSWGYSVNNLSITLAGGTYPAGPARFCGLPLRSQELVLRVCRILVQEVPSTRREAEFPQPVRVDSLIGESAIFQAQVEKVPLFAGVDATVLLGRNGHGKEVFARAIHYSSPRRDRAFIPINCAALPDQLFENELFGHAKGAYTSAAQEQGGLVLEAGGTCFSMRSMH